MFSQVMNFLRPSKCSISHPTNFAVMGLPSSAYWLANWMFDAAGMTLFSVFGIIVYRASIYSAGSSAAFQSFSVWIVITCLATPLHAYTISRFFSSHSKAQVISLFIFDMFALLPV
jgi:uncharacterized membrane protein YhdT